VYHSSLGSRVIKKKKKVRQQALGQLFRLQKLFRLKKLVILSGGVKRWVGRNPSPAKDFLQKEGLCLQKLVVVKSPSSAYIISSSPGIVSPVETLERLVWVGAGGKRVARRPL
jgi:hypothetical protein